MPILGLTDNIIPRFRRLGKLRKGGEKTAGGYGPDLDHFRFTSDQPEIVEAFHRVYGKEPRLIRIYIPHESINEAFSTWCEVWSASGLVHRCNGKTMFLWREGDKYLRGERPCSGGHEKNEPQNDAVGRLEFIIPELIQAGYVGYVTLETHSINDILAIGGVLQAVHGSRHDLRGVEFSLRRIQENIGVPGWGDRKGDRSRADKWLVKIEPAADWVRLQLETARAEALALPAPAAATVIDGGTGEVITQLGPSSLHPAPPAVDEPPSAEELKFFGPRPGANGGGAPVGAPAQRPAAAPPASNGNSISKVANDHVSEEPFWTFQFALGRWATETGRPESEFKAALKAYVEHNGFKGYSSRRDTDYARQLVALYTKEHAHV